MNTRSVTVTGQGITSVVPDSAVARVAAVARAQGVAAAFRACSSTATQISVVARRHTDEKHIASTGINVWPWYDQHGQPAGFEARHSMSIACPDLDTAGALLAELATDVGDALAVDGVALEVSSPAAAQEQAVAAAYDDALRQATQLAALAGASLGEVLAIGRAGSPGGGFPQGDSMVASAKLEPGQTDVAASLTITWALAAGDV